MPVLFGWMEYCSHTFHEDVDGQTCCRCGLHQTYVPFIDGHWPRDGRYNPRLTYKHSPAPCRCAKVHHWESVRERHLTIYAAARLLSRMGANDGSVNYWLATETLERKYDLAYRTLCGLEARDAVFVNFVLRSRVDHTETLGPDIMPTCPRCSVYLDAVLTKVPPA